MFYFYFWMNKFRRISLSDCLVSSVRKKPTSPEDHSSNILIHGIPINHLKYMNSIYLKFVTGWGRYMKLKSVVVGLWIPSVTWLYIIVVYWLFNTSNSLLDCGRGQVLLNQSCVLSSSFTFVPFLCSFNNLQLVHSYVLSKNIT